MITVHHLNDSRSQRILWLLEELHVPYEVKRYERDPATRMAPPELVAVHRLGKSPVVTDGGRTVAESGAIIDYLLRRYADGRLQPDPSSRAYEDYAYWMHYAEGSAMPALIVRINVARVGDAAAASLPRLDREVAAQLGFMEAGLGAKPYFLGDDLTAADIQLSFVGELAAARFGLAAYPGLQAWVKRFQARPAYKTALGSGGPYAFAP